LWALQLTHQAFDPCTLSQVSGQSEADAAFDLALSGRKQRRNTTVRRLKENWNA